MSSLSNNSFVRIQRENKTNDIEMKKKRKKNMNLLLFYYSIYLYSYLFIFSTYLSIYVRTYIRTNIMAPHCASWTWIKHTLSSSYITTVKYIFIFFKKTYKIYKKPTKSTKPTKTHTREWEREWRVEIE